MASMGKDYALREESFGFTFFDKKKLRHLLLLKNELEDFRIEMKLNDANTEILKIKRKKFRKDILFSPIRIYYELTLGCSLRCRYCYNSSGQPRKNELETKQIIQSLDQFKQNNVMDIRFTGGELTCKKDWYTILKYAKELDFAISCNTNAAYYNPKLCEQLAELKLNQVTISLDGDKNSHEMNRGKGTFDRTLNNIQIMHSLGVRLRINTLVNRYSFKDVERMLEIASKYADEINFFTIVFIGRGSQLESTDGISLQDHYKMSKKINSLKKLYPNLNILHFAEVSKTTSINTDFGGKFGLKIGPPSGSTTFNVLSNGAYCCGGYLPYIDRRFVLGNVRYDNIFDVWQGNNLLEKIRNDGAKLILFCNKCPEFISNRCQGSKYETELHRLINPRVKNPTCIYGNGPSLLTQC